MGKTSLVELLAARLNLPIIPELGRRMCQEMGYSKIGDIPDQESFKRQVLARQIEEEEALGSFISDRSTIDCWVLWQRWNICSAMTYDTESYYETARAQSKKYSTIIYIPPMFPPIDDGFRWTDLDYQKQIDRLVRMTLLEWELWSNTYVIQSDGADLRAAEVLSWLQ